MKTFWSIIGALVVATLAVWTFNGGGGLRRTGAPATGVPAAQAPMARAGEGEAARAEKAAGKSGDDVKGALDGDDSSPALAAPSAPVAVTTPPSPQTAPATSPTSAGHNAYHGASAKPTAAGDTTGGPMAELSNLLKDSSPAKPALVVDAEKTHTPAPASGDAGAGPGLTSADSASKYTLGPPTEVKAEEDGWTRLDGKYLVRGSGTASDPLIVPWELLVSASETYRPRTGTKEMPRRVADLKGKHVKVTGYALFPLMSMETTELLLMRNQWDGCCIGVPPTPYDAVEVKLAKPADRKDSLLTFVTLEGVIDVDPYVNRDFLLGLYTMSGATLVQPAKGSDADKGL